MPRGHPAYKFIETLYDHSTQSKQPFFDFEPIENFQTALASPDKKVSEAKALKIISGLLRISAPAQPNLDRVLTRSEAAQLVYQHVTDLQQRGHGQP